MNARALIGALEARGLLRLDQGGAAAGEVIGTAQSCRIPGDD